MFAAGSSAQLNWLRKAGGTNLDEAVDIARAPVSNDYYVTGHFAGVSNFTIQNISSSGGSDAFLAKYDEDGNPLWAKRFGGASTDRSFAVVSDNGGNAHICGFYSGTATFGTVTLTAIDSSDVFVAKLNPQGDVIWAKSAGGSGSDAAVGIALDLSGNVIITGQFRGQADFGTFSLTSVDYDGGGSASTDIFTAKLDLNGNWTWVRQGSATGDERPTDVCTDGQNNIYICGQFSNDIVFDSNHANDIENVGYLVKYNSSGQEQWFSKIAATLALPNAVRCDNQSNVIVTGESIGQLIFFGTNTEIVPSTNLQSIFLAKYSGSGAVSWAKEDGSDSYVSAKALSIGAQNEIYVAGLFDCTFSEYADELGDGLFNSAGYRDVFALRYNNDGNRAWMRQYGGPREEFCSAICAGPAEDQPRMAGSFEKYFHVPSTASSFQLNPTNYIPGINDGLTNPNSGSLCGYDSYGEFVHLNAQANKDIFIGYFVNLALPHYDIYARGDCSFPVVEACINDTEVPLVCTDSISVCGSAALFLTLNTGTNDWVGPDHSWEWNNGDSDDNISVEETGWYSIEVEREDGCASYEDSIWVEILELPEPTITDDQGINIESPPDALEIILCAPAEVELTGGNEGSGESYWIGPDGFESQDNPITVSTSGVYSFITEGENGCSGQNNIPVNIIDPLEEIDPLLQFDETDQPLNDTLVICGNDYITAELIDLMEQEDFPIYTDAIWQISLDTGFYPPYEGFETYTFFPQVGGWHYINVTPFLFTPEPCAVDTIWYPEQELSVYIVLLDDPNPQPQLSGGGPICPGDTLMLTASGSTDYIWSGPGIIQYISADTVLINEPGNYLVSVTQEFDNGCSSTGVDGVQIPAIPQPVITSEPGHAVICPGEDLELTAQPGESYEWFGPLGQELGNTQSIVVNQPGNYYCTVTVAGCTQESNVIEAEVYATPYILLLPNADLCSNGMVTMIIQSHPDAVIEWQAPLSGDETFQNVFEPDTYTVIVEFCDIETEVSAVVTMTEPVATIVASGEILCPGGGITLTANAGMSDYTWNPGGQSSQSIIVSQPGTYSVEIENENGCDDESESIVIEMYNLATPIVQDEQVCYGEEATLIANGQGVFWATDFAGTDVVFTGSIFETEPVFGETTYFAFAEDENCTTLPVSVDITIYSSSNLTIEEMDVTYCAGESFTLSTQEASGPGLQYSWTFPDGNEENTATVVIDESTPEMNGWFTLQVQDIYCESAPDSIFITVENPVNTALIAEDSIGLCVLSELLIASTIEAPDYNWQTPLGSFGEQVIIIDEADFNAAGQYSLTIEGIHCAINSDTVAVDVVEYPDIELHDSLVYCDRGYMTAHLPAGYDQYQWSNGDIDNETIVPLDGFLSVVVTNHPFCSDRDSIEMDNIDCLDEFPNIFTPNGDGDNDYVDFGWLRIPIDEVLIFNRWGNLIRHLTNDPFVWDGKTEMSELVSDGVYFYVVKSAAPGKHFRNTSGYIHVLGDHNNVRN